MSASSSPLFVYETILKIFLHEKRLNFQIALVAKKRGGAQANALSGPPGEYGRKAKTQRN